MKRPDVTCLITWVYTNDLEQTSKFYADDLGLKLVIDEGAARIYQVSSFARIGVCTAFEDRVVEPKGAMITLVTNQVDEWYSHLTGRGVATKSEPHVIDKFNIYTFFLEDPNGYVIEIQQFLE